MLPRHDEGRTASITRARTAGADPRNHTGSAFVNVPDQRLDPVVSGRVGPGIGVGRVAVGWAGDLEDVQIAHRKDGDARGWLLDPNVVRSWPSLGVREGVDEVFVAVTAATLTETTRLVPGPPVVLIPPLGTKSGAGRPAGKINSRAARLVSWPLQPNNQGLFSVCPRQDSNLRHRLRRAVLYPLSYGGGKPGKA